MTRGAKAIPFTLGFSYGSNSNPDGWKSTICLSEDKSSRGRARISVDEHFEDFLRRFFKRRDLGSAECMEIAKIGKSVNAV